MHSYGVWGSAAGSGTEPQPKWNLVHFGLKIWHPVATILMIFMRNFAYKNAWDNILAGGNVWVKWNAWDSRKMGETWRVCMCIRLNKLWCANGLLRTASSENLTMHADTNTSDWWVTSDDLDEEHHAWSLRLAPIRLSHGLLYWYRGVHGLASMLFLPNQHQNAFSVRLWFQFHEQLGMVWYSRV